MTWTGKSEKDFEAEIVASLVGEGGYAPSTAEHFDPELGLDSHELFAWVSETQWDRWERLVVRYGGDEQLAQRGFLRRVSDEVASRGTIDVLRRGVSDQMLNFEIAVFKPATTMNESHAARYNANRLTVTRQLRYSSKHTNTLDTALFVNGLLVATAELKNPLTGQTVDHAIEQYKRDRDPSDSTLRRAVVHFAVDPFLVYMTTRLASSETTFLPFNQGNNGGKGNPRCEDRFDTSYLWETVWQRDAWLDILNRFVQISGRTRDPRVIFPRYHQWDAVRKLEEHARTHGAGHRYLIQHSAGSGKSNSISWLAHRLSTLHDDQNEKVFSKVLVITDRRVLDEQLRANVQSFEKVAGTVLTVTGRDQSKSSDLAAALDSAAAKIIVTTLQVFPYLLSQELDPEIANRRYAIIIDEAHSSQTGDAAAALRQALGSGAKLEDESDAEEALAEVLRSRGHQSNLSFFAFTATPKDKTNEVFGTTSPDGTKRAFHLYAMRQAIEEGFILDVLRNYTTYKSYFKLSVATEDAGAQELEVGKAAAALRQMVVRDPDVIAAKAKIMVEHFRVHTAKKIRGQAKAMVVTDGRSAAVRYKRAIDLYLQSAGYTDLRTLVAFSGTVTDPLEGPVTEASLNEFPESQTALRFTGSPPYMPGEYQVLIVAEKFQTGFDEPLLHTMFVDKPLTGLATVQTLSRLNRAHPDKFDTFVLDFRNDVDSVQRDFQRYYQATITAPTDANALSDAYARVTAQWPVLDEDEMAEVVARHFTGVTPGGGLGIVYAAFGPALQRYEGLASDEQTEFRAALDGYLTLYSFMSQVLPWVTPDLERAYLFGKALAQLLPRPVTGSLEIGDDVVLTHLRLAESSSGAVELDPGTNLIGSAYPGAGRGPLADPVFETLAGITEELNRRFGLDLTDAHRLAFQQFEVTWLEDDDLREVAEANELPGFRLEFERKFTDTVLDAQELNSDLYDRLYGDQEFRGAVLEFYVGRMHEALRRPVPAVSIEVLPRGTGTESPWVDRLGPFYDEDAVGTILRRLPSDAIAEHDVLALTTAGGQVVFPAAQFRNNRVAPGLSLILDLLPEVLVSPWTLASWLTSPDRALHGEIPLEVLFTGGEAGVARVVKAARDWAGQLGA